MVIIVLEGAEAQFTESVRQSAFKEICLRFGEVNTCLLIDEISQYGKFFLRHDRIL